SLGDLGVYCFFCHVESLIVSVLILVRIGAARKAVICWSFTKGNLSFLKGINQMPAISSLS
ncbi:hypothetical protein, partial [Yersinia intermedia]|uniref:hypothetical protein n=1 Tax=Yersinia intermedia TaxID=631 RepID=UPI001C126A59